MTANFFYFLRRANGEKWFTKNPANFKRMILFLLMLVVKLPRILLNVLEEPKLLVKTKLKTIIIILITITIARLPIGALLLSNSSKGRSIVVQVSSPSSPNTSVRTELQERPPANSQLGRHMCQCENSLLGAGPHP